MELQTVQMEIAIVGVIQAVIVAIIGGMFAHNSQKNKKALEHSEKRASLRQQESMQTMSIVHACLRLCIATARAIKDKRSNGEIDNALKTAIETENAYDNFIQSIAAKQIATHKE